MAGAGALVRGSFLSGAGMIGGLLCALALIKLITNAKGLSPADIDLYMMVTPASDFLLVLFNFGLRAALPSMLAAASPERQERMIRSAYGLQLAALGIAAALILGLTPLAAHLYPGAPGYTLGLLLALLVACSSLREMGMATLAGLHHYAARSFGLIAVPLFHAVFFGLMILTTGASLTILIGACIAANAVTALSLYVALPHKALPALERQPLAECLRFSFPLYLNSLFTMVFQRLDTIIVGLLCPVGTAGVFEVAAKRIPLYASGLLNAGLVPFLPGISERIARKDFEAASRMLQRTYAVFAFAAYAGFLLTLVVERPLILLISAERYLEGLPALGPIMAATLILLLAGLMGQSLIALGKSHLVTWTNLATALLSLGLNAALIPKFGMLGAGYAALLSAIASMLVQTRLVRGLGLAFPWRLWAKPHVILALCILLTAPVPLSLANRRITMLLTFIALSFLTRLISMGEIRDFMRHLRGRSQP